MYVRRKMSMTSAEENDVNGYKNTPHWPQPSVKDKIHLPLFAIFVCASPSSRVFSTSIYYCVVMYNSERIANMIHTLGYYCNKRLLISVAVLV